MKGLIRNSPLLRRGRRQQPPRRKAQRSWYKAKTCQMCGTVLPNRSIGKFCDICEMLNKLRKRRLKSSTLLRRWQRIRRAFGGYRITLR